ncbi:hypothetical protein [Sphingobium sp. Z007]|uniref:hypothetical protein n=1 Tax=Sphingobium sp. Z007 TaxID=627495 RepID=UPI000B4A1074|nr:hypothetical protein [Sphingobium sp. Z007]
MSYHDPILPTPTPAPQIRVDGWSPARQRRFLEVLAATGVIRLACEAVYITTRSAYTLRIRRDGAAFRLGWDAAILIARARLADTLLARAIMGTEETIRKDPDNHAITRHRHDNRLAMSMLARLDRMADCPAEGSDAALARVVAQDFAAYCDMLCPEADAQAEAESLGLPRTGTEPTARLMEDATLYDGSMPDTPAPIDSDTALSSKLSPGASAALFVAARMALHKPQNPHFSVEDERCELRDPPPPDLADLPPEEAANRLRGIWWDDRLDRWRTDFPPPPGFDGDASDTIYDVDDYERDLTEAEEDALAAQQEAERRPYEQAASRARDDFFGFVLAQDAGCATAVAEAG